uniref:Uncharacterized protein n=1 Tax=Arundo donax TaxID=35708 RepID=A0A0A8XZM0_ARUDO
MWATSFRRRRWPATVPMGADLAPLRPDLCRRLWPRSAGAPW